MNTDNDELYAIDQERYRLILIFFARVIAHFIWWDIVYARFPIVGDRARRTRPNRYRLLARRFRGLAVKMGGVMIKLGQFLSTRVDMLPLEITDELKGLQDEVPPEPPERIFSVLREDLGDLNQRFALVDIEPLAAASLGQAHRAWLLPEDGATAVRGAPVVVKIRRPDIEITVATDLAALRVVAHWFMRYKPIRKRANVPALMEEFATTLWEELDYLSEADNAERFAAMYAGSKNIYIPAVYREHSTARVIVLEDVTAVKITDIEGMKAAGIAPAEVASVLLEAYFQQIFKEGFFHADPHPGNLFVRPYTDAEWQPGEASKNRPFRLTFVDFGMVGDVPELMGENLRRVLVSLTRRDAYEMTAAAQALGFFLPGADLDRITDALRTLLDRVWGRKLLDLAQPDPREIAELSREFRDVLFAFPFQVPQDFVYLGRAVSMVSGLVTQLNPQINPWYYFEKFGEQVIREQSARDISWQGILEAIRPYLETPDQVRRVLSMVENGRIRVQSVRDNESNRRLEKRLNQLSWSIMGAASMVSATLLYLNKGRNTEHGTRNTTSATGHEPDHPD
ncbi:MAG: AarF/ABC1/UbiB kinase family protein [Chloroflexi bacterium]|nr:AarF/ABC1/UbiB kinase family protein [Chloroflexota bacterium]